MTPPGARDAVPPKPLRVFLSYARPNKPRVAKIAAALEAAGIDV